MYIKLCPCQIYGRSGNRNLSSSRADSVRETKIYFQYACVCGANVAASVCAINNTFFCPGITLHLTFNARLADGHLLIALSMPRSANLVQAEFLSVDEYANRIGAVLEFTRLLVTFFQPG